jgi:IS30 family transposase
MTNQYQRQITTSRRDRRSARQGRASVRIFPLAVYATCNPVRHARARQQRSNEARRWRLSFNEAKRIEQLHQSGQTLKQIGATLRINCNIIPRELRVHGIVLTPHVAGAAGRRMWLLDAEVKQIQTMQKQGRTMTYIAEEICVCRGVIRRELRARGLPTSRDRRRRAVKKSIRGWWGTLGDEPEVL